MNTGLDQYMDIQYSVKPAGSEMFRYLDGPVQRVGSTFTPVGFNPILEKEILPDEAKIYEAAKKVLEY